MKVVAIIQARMGSTRLPGKVMKKLMGRTVLSHVIERVRQAKLVNDIVIATTTGSQDDVIEAEAEAHGCKVFRGSEDDVLSRYYYAATEHQADVIVRITSDCPLIDPHVIDMLVDAYLNGTYELVTNAGAEENRTFPRGLDTEVFSYQSLEDAFLHGKEQYHREHVTPFIYEDSKHIHYFKHEVNYSHHRWTLDTPEDFALISEIYDRLYRGKHDFYLAEIINLFAKEPELYTINAHIQQKKL